MLNNSIQTKYKATTKKQAQFCPPDKISKFNVGPSGMCALQETMCPLSVSFFLLFLSLFGYFSPSPRF
jgi:hypothetical protein